MFELFLNLFCQNWAGLEIFSVIWGEFHGEANSDRLVQNCRIDSFSNYYSKRLQDRAFFE